MKPTLAAIDPGEHQGWAVYGDDRHLIACGLGPLPARFVVPRDSGIERAVIERPHAHGKRARLVDIITLAIRAGETGGPLRAAGIEITYVEPATWKGGSISKDIDHARTWAKLSPNEQAVVATSCKALAVGKQHNVMDAVGIGLSSLGR